MVNKVDIEVTVRRRGGEIAAAGAIRYGISLCLANIVNKDTKEKMRLGKNEKHTRLYIVGHFSREMRYTR